MNRVLTPRLTSDTARAARTAATAPNTTRASTFTTRPFLRVLCTVAAPRLDLFAVDLQDGLGVGGVLVGGHPVHQPALRPLMEVFDQQPGVVRRPAPDHHADD